jgi:hypothetical protein
VKRLQWTHLQVIQPVRVLNNDVLLVFGSGIVGSSVADRCLMQLTVASHVRRR